ncbi:MAG: hypothetical protein RL226_704 [Bacteroidota bacterium]
MKSGVYQEQFIALLKHLVPAQVNLARDISELLNISADGAYRRLRGETAFSLDETVQICIHYHIPLEALNDRVDDVVTFQYTQLSSGLEAFNAHIAALGNHLRQIRKHEQAVIHYAAEDIPLFYHFGFEALAQFKVFYWQKSILNLTDLDAQHFSAGVSYLPADELVDLYNQFAKIPSVEIWTEETIASTLQQIKFYWEAGFFNAANDALLVLDDVDKLLSRISRQAEIGQKINAAGASTGVQFQLYLCDLMIGNNSILVEMGESKVSFIGYNTFNSIHTRNRIFNSEHAQWVTNLQSKSIQISMMAEKIRNQFFKAQSRKVNDMRVLISGETT